MTLVRHKKPLQENDLTRGYFDPNFTVTIVLSSIPWGDLDGDQLQSGRSGHLRPVSTVERETLKKEK